MTAQRNFAEAEENMASVFAEAANQSNLKQIVYLGGLGEDNLEKSLHLQSRHNVGKILAAGQTPVSELRAAVIIGSGSASFEMLRSLVEVLPIMVVPRWVTKTQCQPISIGDVLENLLHVLNSDEPVNHILEIGGPEVVTYREMMHAYTKVAGLRRRVILPVPVLTPRLSSHWVNLVSPLPFTLARAPRGVAEARGGEGDRRRSHQGAQEPFTPPSHLGSSKALTSARCRPASSPARAAV